MQTFGREKGVYPSGVICLTAVDFSTCISEVNYETLHAFIRLKFIDVVRPDRTKCVPLLTTRWPGSLIQHCTDKKVVHVKLTYCLDGLINILPLAIKLSSLHKV